MDTSYPLTLSPEDKLDALQFLDEFRFWNSLDDERRCTRCHETITGRQILVSERNGTRGSMRLKCPTPGCPSSPSEWAYADPMLFATRGTVSAKSSHSHHYDARAGSTRSRHSEIGARAVNYPRGLASLRAALPRLELRRPFTAGFRLLHGVADKVVGFFRIFDSGRGLKTGVQR